ncbi:MAG TPA: peptide chain release factor N(5)-glutamine methyltransferase [Flavisolibacter sp.]|nr:peptide chain release factor N(5)-glutamine methyltransferase [Flavisolibacter sp.]
MKTGAAEQWLRQQLRTVYDESEANNIAAMVMEHITQANRVERLKSENELLNGQLVQHLSEIEQRLLKHEPVQYVLGEAWFYHLKLFVDKHVLIPRPETEELVHWIITDIKAKGLNVFERGPAEADVTTQLKILDIGTGSGCIALALKNTMPKAEVWGCDVSEEALNVARRNGSELDIRVDFQGVDILDEAQHRLLPTVDVIVSNPPYIPLKDKDTMHPNVLEHEPHLALFVPDNDALKFYKAIAQFAKKRLYDNACIYFEIHEDLGAAVVSLFESEGYVTELRKDMQGKHRMVKATRQSKLAPGP